MAISIAEKYQDVSGKWSVRMTNGAESLFLSFDHDPTLEEVQAAGQIAISNIIAKRQAQKDDGENKRTLMDFVLSYDSATWTNIQKQTLLDALVSRIKAKRQL